MRRAPRILSGLSLFLVGWIAAIAPAADDVLSVVPEDALGVVIVNKPGEINEKLANWAMKLSLPLPPGAPLTMLKARLGIEEGLDEKGTVALAVVPGADSDAQPVPVLFLPTTDYAKLIKPLNPENATAKITKISLGGDTSIVGKKGSFAVISPRSSAEDVLKRVLDSTDDMSKKIGSLGAYAGSADLCAIVGPAGVKFGASKGAEAIEKAKEQFGAQGGDNEQMQMLKAMMGMYADLLKGAEKDLTHLAVAVRMAKEGEFHLGSRLVFRSESSVGKMLAAAKPAEANVLSGLPEGPFVVAGGGVIPSEMMEGLMGWSVNMMKAMPGGEKLTKEKAEKLAKLSMEEVRNVKSIGFRMGVGEEKDSIYGAMSGVMKVGDAKKYIAEYKRAVSETMKELEGIDLPYMGKMVAKDFEYEGKTGIEIDMEIPGIGGKDAPPGLEDFMEKLLAPGGKLKAYVVAVDATTVVAAYVSKENLTKAIKAASQNGLGGDAEVRKTTSLLPSGSQMVGYLSPKGAFDFGMRIAQMVAGDAVPPIPSPPPMPPIGFALKASSEGLETDLVIPAGTLEAIIGYGLKLREF